MTAIAQPVTNGSSLLRRAAQVDAVLTGLVGAVFTADAASLGPLLGIPAMILMPLGAAMVLWAVALGYIASRPVVSRRFVWTNIVLGVFWIVESAVLLMFGWLPLTPAGWWVVVALAVTVDLLIVAQYFGLRRAQ